MREIDRTKFPRSAFIVTSWSADARKWFCAMFASADSDTVLAAGQGGDPFEAMLSMCIELGAVTDDATAH